MGVAGLSPSSLVHHSPAARSAGDNGLEPLAMTEVHGWECGTTPVPLQGACPSFDRLAARFRRLVVARIGSTGLTSCMVQLLHAIRGARPEDAEAIASTHDAAWREAYRGIIPGRALEAMVERRGPSWWLSAIRRGSRILVLEFDAQIVGYASLGRNRFGTLPYAGEIFELYLKPEFQGLGYGSRLFRAVRADLASKGYLSTVVWALADNERALRFYERMGGVEVWRASERFDMDVRTRVAFGFAAR